MMDAIGGVTQRLEELAAARVNDAVKLAFLKNEQIGEIDGLELTALRELRRNPNGVVEMSFIDRLAVLDKLAGMLGDGEDKAEALLRAMGREAAEECE